MLKGFVQIAIEILTVAQVSDRRSGSRAPSCLMTLHYADREVQRGRVQICAERLLDI